MAQALQAASEVARQSGDHVKIKIKLQMTINCKIKQVRKPAVRQAWTPVYKTDVANCNAFLSAVPQAFQPALADDGAVGSPHWTISRAPRNSLQLKRGLQNCV